ncbi:MAG: XrtB/PEP-CTERM-associated transcriptional regulator EpsA [Burkholderiales bacterium]
MQLDQPSPRLRSELPPIRFARPAAREFPAAAAVRTQDCAQALDELEVEALMLNLDAALRVYQRVHFFSWTQGLLQGLIPHEALICALPGGDASSMRAESFSTVAPQPAIFGEAFLRDSAGALNLVKAWQEGGFRPLIRDAADGPFAKGLFAQALEQVGATQILAHGTHDANGLASGFYAYLCAPGTLGPRHAHLARMVTPFVHDAWVRTEVNGRAHSIDGPRPGEPAKVTGREQEILRWVALGKSNFEIGAILVISPLTVKNHVQKILRKLDVVNRAQAVGKALELRILRS